MVSIDAVRDLCKLSNSLLVGCNSGNIQSSKGNSGASSGDESVVFIGGELQLGGLRVFLTS